VQTQVPRLRMASLLTPDRNRLRFACNKCGIPFHRGTLQSKGDPLGDMLADEFVVPDVIVGQSRIMKNICFAFRNLIIAGFRVARLSARTKARAAQR
jgi:hypothetical protein